jgi:GT2 family glycosyltransferase
MPSVEAVIPVYNETVDSILVTTTSINSQGYPINRILLVDDGSTHPPNFDAVIGASQIPVFVLRKSSNAGISAARNYAARHSNADFLLFVNSDIELLPDWVEKTVNFLTRHPDAGLASGQVSSFQKGLTAEWRKWFLDNRDTWIDQTHEIDWAWGHALIIATRHLWQVGGWNEALRRAFEDVDLSQRLWRLGLKTYQVQGAIGICHELYSIRDLAAKTIRNWGWSLDPAYPGDPSLKPLEFFRALKHFLVMSSARTRENLRAQRLTLVPIDLAVTCCGVGLIFQCGIRKLRLGRTRLT